MILEIIFEDDLKCQVDTVEFGADGMGETLDHLAIKHGGIKGVVNHENIQG